MKDVIQTGYEEIKQNLLNNGFELCGNDFVKNNSHQSSIFINGHQHIQEIKNILIIRYIGKGEEGGSTLYGFDVLRKQDEEQLMYSIWVKNWLDFVSLTQAGA